MAPMHTPANALIYSKKSNADQTGIQHSLVSIWFRRLCKAFARVCIGAISVDAETAGFINFNRFYRFYRHGKNKAGKATRVQTPASSRGKEEDYTVEGYSWVGQGRSGEMEKKEDTHWEAGQDLQEVCKAVLPVSLQLRLCVWSVLSVSGLWAHVHIQWCLSFCL